MRLGTSPVSVSEPGSVWNLKYTLRDEQMLERQI